MSEPTIVYVLEAGCYSDKHLIALFRTAQAAMDDFGKGTWSHEDGEWSNDLDWDDFATVRAMVVQGPASP